MIVEVSSTDQQAREAASSVRVAPRASSWRRLVCGVLEILASGGTSLARRVR